MKLIQELLFEAQLKSKLDFFLAHEKASADADFYINDSEHANEKKAKAARKQAEKILQQAATSYGSEFAKSVENHTDARLDALYSGRPEKEGAAAAAEREKHGIDHQEYDDQADFGVRPSLLVRKDSLDPKAVKKMRQVLPVLTDFGRIVDVMTSKKSSTKQVKDATAEFDSAKSKLISMLQSM